MVERATVAARGIFLFYLLLRFFKWPLAARPVPEPGDCRPAGHHLKPGRVQQVGRTSQTKMRACCNRCNDENDCERYALCFEDCTTINHFVLCEDCFVAYEQYVVDDECDDSDVEQDVPEADPEDAECEDDPCTVMHYAVACGDYAENPM